jgi:pilus assembly protein CpaB
MNPKALVPLVLGLAIAGFAAKLGFDNLRQARGNTEMVELWTVSIDVPRGSAISQQELRPLSYPADAMPPGALTKKDQIVGRVPHTGVPANVPVLDSMLLAPGTSPGIHVPEGLRAVAVKIDEGSGVDNHLQPGVYVDVIGLFTVRQASKTTTVAKTVVEKVQVAAVGPRLSPETPNGAEDGNNGKKSPSKPARAVTLLVQPDQVPKLHLAEQKGKIKLSMRGAEDSPGVARDTTITEAELLGTAEPKEEKPAPTNTFGDRMATWLESLTQQAEAAEPIDEAPQVALAPPKPQYVWKMTVYNGDERQDLGWLAGRPREPVLLGGGGPNVFEDNDRGANRPPRIPATQTPQTNQTPQNQTPIQPLPVPPNQPQQTPVQDAEPNQPTPQTEPKELFE